MDFKTILGYWKESFSWLHWSELKTLLLLTLNNFVRSLKTMLTYFSWLIVLNLILTCMILKSESAIIACTFTQYDFLSCCTRLGVLEFIAALINIIMIFCYFLTARASLERKDLSYFAKYYIPKFPWFLLFWLICGKLLPMVMFFFLDAGNTLRDFFESFKRGLLLHIYFLPCLLSIYMLSACIGLILAGGCLFLASLCTGCSGFSVISMVFYLLATIIFFVMTFLNYSFFAIMYSKIKHSHYQLFFK